MSVCRACCTAGSYGPADKRRTASAIRPSSASTSQSIKDIPGVQIIRRHNFVGVVAEREWDAVRAARQLKVTWEPFASALPGHERLFDAFKSAKTNDLADTDAGDVNAALSRGAHVISASYRGPYQSHGTMAPNCALADVTKDGALIVCSDQGIYQTRAGVARLIGLPVEKIRVQYCRRLEHLWQQLLPRRRSSGCHLVAGGRQAGSGAVQPRGRIRVGQLRAGASVRPARGGR